MLLSQQQLSTDVLDTPDDLGAIACEWNQLWLTCPDATPFQCPQWLLAVWKNIGEGELFVISVRSNLHLVAIAPCFIYRNSEGLRQLMLLGTGLADYNDVLVQPGFERAATQAISNTLQSFKDSWDYCDFQQVRATSPLMQLPYFRGWVAEKQRAEACPVLVLPQYRDGLGNVVSPRLMKNVEYYTRRATQVGELSFQDADSASLPELVEGLFCLHGAEWRTRGGSGVLWDSRVRNVHSKAAPALLSLGVLRLYCLRIGGQLAAIYYGFLWRGRAYYYLSGFDPQYASLSLGNIIVHHAICEAIGERARSFDFLRGGEPYKYRWGARDQESYTIKLRSAVEGREVQL